MKLKLTKRELRVLNRILSTPEEGATPPDEEETKPKTSKGDDDPLAIFLSLIGSKRP